MPTANPKRATVRIIGGQWRGRKIDFPDLAGLRPTPDRVRETVFNWLQPQIHGAHCLDLFAGSGALGLEALSRGADHVIFVEREHRAVTALSANLQKLQASGGELRETDALAYLARPVGAFDIVFLDPPFQSALLGRCTDLLVSGGWVKVGGLIYIEAPSQAGPVVLPPAWELYRSKTAGQVGYHLARQLPT